jgi:uncharacterized surface protein with fasciclin (FAS1) repeats
MTVKPLALALLSAIALSACMGHADTRADAPMASAPMSSAAMSSDAAMPMSHEDPMVGGAMMYPSKDIIDNAVNSKDHTTLVAAVKAAGLVDTLKGAGPFTVFAPTNAAFDVLPAGTVDTLLKPENKATLTKVLTYHVVPGRLDSAALAAKIQAGGGSATLTTVEGEPLKVWMQGNAVVVTDSKGNNATVTTADVYQKNGVIHVVDKVLMP